MNKAFFRFLLSFSIFFQIFSFTALSAEAAAIDRFNSSLKSTGNVAGYNLEVEKKRSIQQLIGDYLGLFLSFLGVIFFLLTIYAGFRWMTARGNEQKIETAKNTLQAALIGLVIVLGAYALTAFMGAEFGGSGEVLPEVEDASMGPTSNP